VPAALARVEEASALLDELGGIEEGEALVPLVHAEVLCAAGREVEARERIGAAAARLRERAARIADDAWRVSFVDGVREHRRTLELAVAWGAPPVSGA
jgi:eukaryotic-like serine/threonine-protein kinase